MRIIFTKELKHCRDGQIYPTTYEPGEADVPEDVADFALLHGFAVKPAKPKTAKK